MRGAFLYGLCRTPFFARSCVACLVALCPLVLAKAQTRQAPAAEVSVYVSERLASAGHADVMAVYDDFPDLSAAAQLSGKEEKARYVYAALRQNARRHAGLLDALATRGTNAADLWIANAVHVPHADPATVELLRQTPGVREVTAVQTWQIDELETAQLAPPPSKLSSRSSVPTWGIRDIGAEEVWDLGIRGQGAVVAGGDTGYDWTHPALRGQYRGTLAVEDDTAAVTHDYHWYDGVRVPFDSTDTANPCGFGVAYPCERR